MKIIEYESPYTKRKYALNLEHVTMFSDREDGYCEVRLDNRIYDENSIYVYVPYEEMLKAMVEA